MGMQWVCNGNVMGYTTNNNYPWGCLKMGNAQKNAFWMGKTMINHASFERICATQLWLEQQGFVNLYGSTCTTNEIRDASNSNRDSNGFMQRNTTDISNKERIQPAKLGSEHRARDRKSMGYEAAKISTSWFINRPKITKKAGAWFDQFDQLEKTKNWSTWIWMLGGWYIWL